MSGVRVLLVEDHAVLTQTLAIALRAEGFEVEAADDLSAERVIASAQRSRPHVVLLDLDLGTEDSGVAMIGPLRTCGCEVLVITGTRDRRMHAESLEAGALGIFAKSDPFDHLVETLRIAAGHGPVTSEVTQQELLRELRESRAAARAELAPFERLTDREKHVLEALADGRSADQIAGDRVVSVTTVRTQIRSILTKLGVNSQLAAVAMARRAGWPRS